jgi:hypothetical protein
MKVNMKEIDLEYWYGNVHGMKNNVIYLLIQEKPRSYAAVTSHH